MRGKFDKTNGTEVKPSKRKVANFRSLELWGEIDSSLHWPADAYPQGA